MHSNMLPALVQRHMHATHLGLSNPNHMRHVLLSSKQLFTDLLGIDSGSKSKTRRKSRPLSGMSTASNRPALVSATEVAKSAMKAQEPQLLDKMENVAYRLAAQADERKKRMNSRCCWKCQRHLGKHYWLPCIAAHVLHAYRS